MDEQQQQQQTEMDTALIVIPAPDILNGEEVDQMVQDPMVQEFAEAPQSASAAPSYFYYDFPAPLELAASTTGDKLSDIGNANFFKAAQWCVS